MAFSWGPARPGDPAHGRQDPYGNAQKKREIGADRKKVAISRGGIAREQRLGVQKISRDAMCEKAHSRKHPRADN